MVVFRSFSLGCGDIATSVAVLRFLGVPESLLRDNPGRKMDDVVAARVVGPDADPVGNVHGRANSRVDLVGPP